MGVLRKRMCSFRISHSLTCFLFSQVVMMLVAGYFRIRYALPQPIWKYPLSYIAFHTYSVQVKYFSLVSILSAFISIQLNVQTWTYVMHLYTSIELQSAYLTGWGHLNRQGLLENEYVGTSFAVGQVRAIPGVQAVRGSYDISYSRNAKWDNLLVLFLMATGYQIFLFVLLHFHVRKKLSTWRFCWLGMMCMTRTRWFLRKCKKNYLKV